MRHLRTTFEDDAFAELEAAKGDRSWREAIKDEFGVTDD